MNSTTLILFLVGWLIRSTLLVAIAGACLRKANAHLQLTVWTGVLIAMMLLPVAGALSPSIAIPFSGEETLTLPNALALRLPVQTNTVDAGSGSRLGWADVAVGVWLAVALVLLLRLAIGTRLAHQLRKQSTPVFDGVFESAQLRVPVTIGLFRSVVILPADWRDWPAEKLDSVMAHERSHAERRDPLRQFAASVLRSVGWFHPLTWWLRSTMVRLAEMASDDAALGAGADRLQFAETLLSFIVQAQVRMEGVAMANRSTRSCRMDRILDGSRRLSRPISIRAKAAISVAAIGLTFAVATLRPVRAFAGPQASIPGTCAARLPYSRWLNEDVAYIIDSRERDAFSKLKASAECDHFVEQFWTRRDPTPGTPENQFKDEHYRRIGYANARFRGWQTDRGHLYILYGPPDEIESHPAGGTAHKEPYEAWLYRHIDGVGTNVIVEFVDRNATGDYRMTLDPSPDNTSRKW